ncbi:MULTISPECIES: recombinase family protein [Listeria]|uniref:recombinase family protein n=1 Tax=Listeria TaxID=1637 RepID=UPI000B594964|nr:MULTISPECIES: recombinase family protein [Listeria]
MKAAIYIRVSTQEQTENYSISAQTEKLKALCLSKGWDIYDIFIDGGFTGSNINRPALQDMLSKLDKIDAVVVYRLDRLSRSQRDTLLLIEEYFLKNDVEFVSLSETLDTSSPFGRAMIGILSVFAQLERETIRDRLVMGKIKRIEDGLPLVTARGRTFGYDVIDTKLFINKEEAEHLQLIYNLFEETQSILQVQKRMKELGYEVFNRRRYKNLLTNDIYIGYVSYADKVHKKGIHEAIIKEEQFNRVQQIFKRVADLPNVNQESQSLLSGLVVCGKCGMPYSHTSKSTSYKGKKMKYRYYQCKSKRRLYQYDDCENIIIRADKLEEIVLNRITKYSSSSKIKQEENKLIKLQNKLNDLQNKKARLLELYLNSNYKKEELDSMTLKIDTQISTILSEKKVQQEKMQREDFKSILEATKFKDIKKLDFKDKQKLLRAIIDMVIINKEDIEIKWL